MRRILLSTATTMAVMLLPLVGHGAQLDALTSLNLEVPSSDATFPDGPGADAMNGNCLACHSADHLLNQPMLPKETWEEIVHKNDQRLQGSDSSRRRRPDRRVSGSHQGHDVGALA